MPRSPVVTMSKYTIKDLIEHGIEQSIIDDAREILLVIQGHVENENQAVVFPFYEAPKALRKACCLNGGDEDWLVITWKEPTPWLPRWIEKTDSCENPDVYLFGNAIVYVGSHA